MDRRETLAQGALVAHELMARFAEGFADDARTTQARDLPNHVAWCVGHSALALDELARLIDGESFDADSFTSGAADGRRFSIADIEYGSTPVDDPARYPRLPRCIAIHERAALRVASALRGAEERSLDREVDWGAQRRTVWSIALRMLFHSGFHGGQVSDLRRALGLSPLFGS